MGYYSTTAGVVVIMEIAILLPDMVSERQPRSGFLEGKKKPTK